MRGDDTKSDGAEPGESDHKHQFAIHQGEPTFAIFPYLLIDFPKAAIRKERSILETCRAVERDGAGVRSTTALVIHRTNWDTNVRLANADLALVADGQFVVAQDDVVVRLQAEARLVHNCSLRLRENRSDYHRQSLPAKHSPVSPEITLECPGDPAGMGTPSPNTNFTECAPKSPAGNRAIGFVIT